MSIKSLLLFVLVCLALSANWAQVQGQGRGRDCSMQSEQTVDCHRRANSELFAEIMRGKSGTSLVPALCRWYSIYNGVCPRFVWPCLDSDLRRSGLLRRLRRAVLNMESTARRRFGVEGFSFAQCS